MVDRLSKMFSSPKFKENKSYISDNLRESVPPLLSSSRYNSTQDELSLELDAKSDGFTSRICDTANSLLLGEFPWGSDRQDDYLTIKQKRQPKPMPVRLRIGPPNSSSLLLSENDSSEYENEEYNSSKSLIQALREMSRKRTHSLMNEESDSEIDGGAAPKKTCKPVEYRHNLYLSQLEEETQEYKNSINSQSEQLLERGKRIREEDTTNSNPMLMGINQHDASQNKRQRRSGDGGVRPPEERMSSVMPCNGSSGAMATTNGTLQQSNRIPRRGSNEIISSLSSSLTLLDPAVLYRLIRPTVPKNRRKTPKKVVAVETQTIEPIPEESPEIKEQGISPKKEDKSMNTDPEKPVRVVVEERQVTDKMANALMKSAVSKFLATEDPTLLPVRSSLPSVAATAETSTPPATSMVKEFAPPIATSNVLSANNDISASSVKPPPTNDKPINNTFTFGTPLNSTSNTVAPISSFTFGSSSNTETTTSSSNLFTVPITTEAVTASKPTDTIKQVSFGDSKLGSTFRPPETNSEIKNEKNNKTEETMKADLFKQPTPAADNVVSTTNTTTEPNKETFSFGFSTPSSTPATRSDPLKTPTFTFGSGNTNPVNFSATPAFLSSEDSSKKTNEPPKLSLFGTSSTPTTTKSAEPKQMGAEATGFQFGNNSDAKKSDKPEEKKPQGLFGFGSVASTPTTKAETKPFAFGTSASTSTAEVSQAPVQQPKPIFQFGSSSFSTTPANKEGFGFGTKPSSEQATPAPTFGSPAGGLFGAKPNAPSTSGTTTTATTTTGLFGFGSVQPPPATTVAPAFGTSTTTTNSSMGGFSFQPNKPEEKPASSGGFAFKFTGTSVPSAEPPKPNFNFGASNTQAPAPAFGASSMTTQPTFGSVTPAASTFPAFSNPSPKPTFGANSAASPAPAPAFGSSTTSAPAPAFGSSTTSAPAPAFGSSTTSATAPAFGSSTTTAPAPAFGSSTTTAPAPAFGSSTTSAPAPAFGSSTTSTPAPAFGSSTTSAPAPAFGSSTTSAPAPAFGSSSTSAPAPAFGNSATSTTIFGTPANQPTPPQLFGVMQTQQTQGPSFTFGASAVSNPNTGFNFNAPAQPSAQPASTGLFQFGSSTNQQNPAGGVQPFQFNAGPTSTPQGFGFSSPIGGFSPGVGGQPMFSIGSGSTAPRTRQLRRKK